jgi:hypothetical protein
MDSSRIQGADFSSILRRLPFQRGMAFGIIIVAALFAFEIFNYSTTDYALADLLGDLSFFGVRWATILAIAFCGIDFAGIARLFTPEDNTNAQGEVWYLFGAWLLAATMNAMLTWWGVSLAVLNHETLGNAVVERTVLLRVVPIFVAVLVWLIRVLIIGTFSVAGDRLFGGQDIRPTRITYPRPVLPELEAPTMEPTPMPALKALKSRTPVPMPRPSAATAQAAFRPAPKSASIHRPAPTDSGTGTVHPRPEPTYTPIHSMSGHNGGGQSEGLSAPGANSNHSASLSGRTGHITRKNV